MNISNEKRRKTNKQRREKVTRNKREKRNVYIFLFLYCYPPIFQVQKMYPKLTMVHPMNGGSSQKKINQNNFPSNVYDEFYSGKRKDANAFSSRGADDTWTDGGGVKTDRYHHSVAEQNTLANVNSRPNKAFNNNIDNYTYDESALSRCALLFIGSLCQQG